MSAINFVPIAGAMDFMPKDSKQTHQRGNLQKNDSENDASEQPLSENFEKAETEEKIIYDIYSVYNSQSTRAGYLLEDLFSIPPEPHDLPDEPPIF